MDNGTFDFLPRPLLRILNQADADKSSAARRRGLASRQLYRRYFQPQIIRQVTRDFLTGSAAMSGLVSMGIGRFQVTEPIKSVCLDSVTPRLAGLEPRLIGMRLPLTRGYHFRSPLAGDS